jgi:protein-tyrosine-phosphatase
MSTLEPKPMTQEVVRILEDHEFEMLKQILETIQVQQQRFSDILYILVGPEMHKDPTLQVTPNGEVVRSVQQEDAEDPEERVEDGDADSEDPR